MHNSTRHSVLKVITIGWSHFQSSSNKPLKLCLICRSELLLLVAFDKRTNSEPCVNQVVKLRPNVGYQFGNLWCQTVTKVGSPDWWWLPGALAEDISSHWLHIHAFSAVYGLTHWGRATHICVGKLTTIVSDNGLSPGRNQAIIRTNAGILLIRPLGTHFSEILNRIQTISFKKMHLKMSPAKWRHIVSASMS